MTLTLTVGVVALALTSYIAVSSGLQADIDRGLLRESEAFMAAVHSGEAEEDDSGLVEIARTYLAARTKAETGAQPILLVRLSDGRVLSNSDVKLETAEGNTELPTAGFSTIVLGSEQYRVATAPILGRLPGGVVDRLHARRCGQSRRDTRTWWRARGDPGGDSLGVGRPSKPQPAAKGRGDSWTDHTIIARRPCAVRRPG
jgi:hypothetical protein